MGSLAPRGSPTSLRKDAGDIAFDHSESIVTPDHRFFSTQWGGVVDRQGKDPEHEMAGALGMSAYPDMTPTELVPEAGVGPLIAAAGPQTHAPGIDIACRTVPPGPASL